MPPDFSRASPGGELVPFSDAVGHPRVQSSRCDSATLIGLRRKPGSAGRDGVSFAERQPLSRSAPASIYPDGHVTSTESTRSAVPNPMRSRGSEADW